MTGTIRFDVYGTPCDTGSVRETLSDELDASEALVAEIDATWRDRQLQYATETALADDHYPFRDVTADALDRWGVSVGECETLLGAYERPTPTRTRRRR